MLVSFGGQSGRRYVPTILLAFLNYQRPQIFFILIFQIILFNPICIVLYAIVSWKFFHDRIFIEEITLLNFFGSKYYDYQQKVPTGIPFIKGYEIEQWSAS